MTRMMAALMAAATIVAGCSTGEQEPSGESKTAESPALSPSVANGNAQKVDVTAVDFAFEGIPETLAAGKTTFVLTNEGEVSHEMTLGRLPAGWTIEEVALESSDSGTEIVGVIDTIGPGASGEMELELEPGRYGYICHEIEGTKGGEKPREHYFHGMIGEFKVE